MNDEQMKRFLTKYTQEHLFQKEQASIEKNNSEENLLFCHVCGKYHEALTYCNPADVKTQVQRLKECFEELNTPIEKQEEIKQALHFFDWS